jgi:hypothetical protein
MRLSLRAWLAATALALPAWASAAANDGIATYFIGGEVQDRTAVYTPGLGGDIALTSGCVTAAAPGCGVAAPGCGLAAPAPACGIDPACGNDDSCNTCYDCANACVPKWSVLAGAAILTRQEDGEGIVVDPQTGGQLVGPNIGVQSGFLFNAVRYRDNCRDIEFGLMAIGTGSLLGLDAFGAPAVIPPGIPLGAAGVALTQYSADIFSFETNIRFRRSDRFSWIGGFRFIGLSETLLFTVLSPPAIPAAGLIKVDNGLWGIQTGAVGTLLQRGNWSVNGWAKAGIYYNDIQTTVAAALPFPVFDNPDANPIAFVGDVQLTATYWFTEQFGVRAGYQLLWFDRVATAPGQLATLGEVNSNSSPFLHGAVVQGEFAW